MPSRIRVDYPSGAYQQGDLERRQRLRDEDVQLFIRHWCGGKDAAWIGTQFRTLTGVPLHVRMVRSHADRLERQGIIPEPWGTVQPTWQEALGRAPLGLPEITPRGVRQRYEGPSLATIRPNNAGRPPKHLANLGDAPQQPGLTWKQQRALRIAQEREAQDGHEDLEASAEAARGHHPRDEGR